MDVVYVAISLSGVLVALVLSVISLSLHWRERDESPAIAALSTRIQEVALQILDLTDKVTHWRGRDSVRKARQGAEDKATAEAEAGIEVPYKQQLRRRARAAQGGADAA